MRTAMMLQQVGVLSADDLAAIQSGLDSIEADIEAGRFEWSVRARRCAYEYRGGTDRAHR